MSLLVKICGLRNTDDVRAAVDAGANAVGFVFAESVRRVAPEEAHDASDNIPPFIRRVAVMRHPSNEEWLKVLDGFAPDVLQTDLEDFDSLDVPYSIERWPVVREGSPVLEDRAPQTFLYEGAQSGTGQTVDWQIAAAAARSGNMILAGGLSSENVAEAVVTVRPFGVDVSSAVEAEPGKKDPKLIHEFVYAARAAEYVA